MRARLALVHEAKTANKHIPKGNIQPGNDTPQPPPLAKIWEPIAATLHLLLPLPVHLADG